MSQDKTVRFGVVGCGMMGERHAAVLRATPGAEVTAVADHQVAHAEKVAQGAQVFTDYDAMLRSGAVDAVVLCLPSNLHADFGLRAARAGKHIVTEKPIDVDPVAGRQLLKESADAGVQCAIISQNRFADGALALKQAIDAGELGKVALIEASVKWMRHEQYYTSNPWRGTLKGEGGGVVMNQGIHTIDLLVWFFGKPVKVHGLKQVNRSYMETEDVGVAVMEFANGALATVSVTTSAFPGYAEYISIHSMAASARLEKGAIKEWKHEADKPAPVAPPQEPDSPGLDGKLSLFQRQYRNILGAIHGTEKLLITPEESIDVLETALAFYR